MKKSKVYSFDVFDTCLCRLCGEPRLLFDVLSLKVQQVADSPISEHMRQLFVAARATTGGKNLTEIYSHVAERYPLPLSVEKMVGLELDTERQMLVPIRATLQLLNRLREEGDILFISDMYLPSTFIRERLTEYGFFKEGDRLFVSDELGAWKHDGSLFHFIHEKEGIPYRHWHHYGDNRHSDYSIPRKLGIHSHRLHYDYLPYEEQWRKIPVLQYQYPAILAGIARAVRLSVESPEDQKAFVCDITAPLMVSWVLHVMTDAQQRGIQHLYFCARDMHTPYLIARKLQSLFPTIKVQYLFISMQALATDEVLLYNFFKQAGVLSSNKVALVDSNSSGNTLIKLNSIATKYHLTQLSGYYIMGWNPSKTLSPSIDDLNSLEYRFFPAYLDCITPSFVRRLTGMRIIYELVLSLNFHKRTVGYECRKNVIRPIFAADTDDIWYVKGIDQKTAKQHNDTLTISFSDAFAVTGLYSFSKEILSQIVTPTLVKYIDRPEKTYLHYLHRFVWWGKPFVGRLHGHNKGVWKRGSIFYTLPQFLASPLRHILASPTLRRKLNHLFH